MYKFTVLKSDSVINTLLAFLKILGRLIESVFKIDMSDVDWKAPIT